MSKAAAAAEKLTKRNAAAAKKTAREAAKAKKQAQRANAKARHVVTSIHTVNQVTTLCASYPSLAVGYAAKTRFVSDGAVAAVMSAGTTSDADLLAASPAPATATCTLRVDDCDVVHNEVLRLLLFGLFLLGLFLGLLLLGLLLLGL